MGMFVLATTTQGNQTSLRGRKASFASDMADGETFRHPEIGVSVFERIQRVPKLLTDRPLPVHEIDRALACLSDGAVVASGLFGVTSELMDVADPPLRL